MPHGERARRLSAKRKELWNSRRGGVSCVPTSRYAKKLTHRRERRRAARTVADADR